MKNVLVSALLAFACTAVFALAPAASPPQRLRGSVESFEGSTLVVKERSGEVMRLVLADNFSVSAVTPIALASIETGSFTGTQHHDECDGVGEPTALRAAVGRDGFTPPM